MNKFFKAVCSVADKIAIGMIVIAFVISVTLVVQSWAYGIKTQWGEFNIDLFPRTYIYLK